MQRVHVRKGAVEKRAVVRWSTQKVEHFFSTVGGVTPPDYRGRVSEFKHRVRAHTCVLVLKYSEAFFSVSQ